MKYYSKATEVTPSLLGVHYSPATAYIERGGNAYSGLQEDNKNNLPLPIPTTIASRPVVAWKGKSCLKKQRHLFDDAVPWATPWSS
ncbi:MAG: hypothetical protein NZ901_07965 [Geminocystis sp.]|nr:hypothetical protein [Geminocystis sp.]HIK37979.1 hypothetical protein [Geminocystis sp. M7585_C2015_104]MCS7148108.1 hypothetical protein [Geminocystis sp.]MCX8077853.1 hypothetical protein [Geminocystis sp.]MDW8116459.1 hypothetical protein [Geminocystis sp.]